MVNQKINLHLTHEDKFLDFFIKNTKKFSGTKNRYIVYSYNDKVEFIKSNEIEIVKADIDELKHKIGNIEQYKTIYIHFLGDFLIEYIYQLNSNINLVWIFWGGDGFGKLKNYQTYFCLEHKTKKIYSKILKNNKIIWYKNYKQFRANKKQTKNIIYKFKNILPKFNYFAIFIYGDYLLMKKKLNISATFFNFNYFTTQQIISQQIIPKNINNENDEINILIGNSSTHTNNHIDVFDRFSNINLSKIKKIYCPLSYGKIIEYKKEVIKYGQIIFKENFVPITDFMPLKKYQQFLSSINIAVFGNIRQQAGANIISLLAQDCCVYMNNKSTLYQQLKTFGFVIFDIDKDLAKNIENEHFYLSKTEKLHNKKILEENFGEKSTQKKYQKLLEL